MAKYDVTVLGAGYTGLTTAAELALSGQRVLVVAKDLGWRPPITIIGTQSRRWPGLALSTQAFEHKDLLHKELKTISRFLALAANPDSGIQCIPALKLSREAGVWWNKHSLDQADLDAATEVQANMKMACRRSVDPSIIEKLYAAGYKSIDTTQVLMVDTSKYFHFLIDIVKKHKGCISLGCSVTTDDISKMSTDTIMNCLGVHSGEVGGAKGTFKTNQGQCVLVQPSPGSCPVYIIDDDKNAAIVECPDGSLYLSSAASPKNFPFGGYDAECTQQTCSDCSLICKAVFGKEVSADDVCESIFSDRPTRVEGFNVGTVSEMHKKTIVQNNGHAGAGVAASWACAIEAARATKRARVEE